MRPLDMLVFEPIVLFTSLYVSLAWSMVFFYFQAYPIIFKGIYGFDVATTSLTYIPSRFHIFMFLLVLNHITNKSSRCRSCLILRVRYSLRWLLGKGQEEQEALGIRPRIPTNPIILRLCTSSGYQLILARMVSESKYPLGRASPLRLPLWTRIPNHLHLFAHLRDRCLPNLLRQCSCSLCNHAKYCWSCFPPRG